MMMHFNHHLCPSGNYSEKPVPRPQDLLQILPISQKQMEFIAQSRKVIQDILSGKDPRLLLIMGPCSIHDFDSALEYANKLKALSEVHSDNFFIVMRVYFEKPRTSLGWKGFAFDPYLDGSTDIHAGLFLTRQLLLMLAERQLPIASEFLELTSGHYFGDLVSWGSIGARTIESQLHRQMASGLTMPMGFKNNTNGNIDVAINGIVAASKSHTFMSVNLKGELSIVTTRGNPECYVMLRGGKEKANDDAVSIAQTLEALKKADLPTKIIIDCSHGNSRGVYKNQLKVFKGVIHQYLEGNHHIRALSLESNLNEGNQPFPKSRGQLKYGISLTDACIGWDDTVEIVEWAASAIKKSQVLLLYFLAFFLMGCCSQEGLSVYSQVVSREELASYHVGTPDPRLNCPDTGQRLYIQWKLPKDETYEKLSLKLSIRFRNHTDTVQVIELDRSSNDYVYSLLNEEYFERQGLLSYKVQLFCDDRLIEEWRHQMWVDLITFPVND